MYLKSIEAVGFKSFADPTVLEFDRGVTAIVGPNGCGKSNVLDAIRWVLGEQSAKALRGGSMQDVIFGGADGRKPLGMAEVSLNFSECEDSLGTDYHEVRITRRVFRDGHGEYEINKTPCRLRDIHRLFMDTGIGRSAYSIMEQGRIDQILSSKPEERRAVFEEAAGITRFKAQKKEALRKLDATEANLIRVGDIVKEVSRQINSLQRQANKARRYKEQFERLKLLDTHLAAHRYAQMRSGFESGQARVEQLQLEFQQLQQGLTAKEAQLKSKRQALEELNRRLQQAEQQKSTVAGRIRSAEQEIEYHRQRQVEMEELKERNRLSILRFDEKTTIHHEHLESTRQALRNLDAEAEEIRQAMADACRRRDELKTHLDALTKERAEMDSQLGGLDEKVNGIRQEISARKARHAARHERLSQLVQEIPEAESELTRAGQLVEEAEAALASTRETAKTLSEKTPELEKECARLEQERSQAEKSLQSFQAEHHHLHLRLQALRDVVQSREGFSRENRSLLDDCAGHGILGALIDFLHVKSGYGEAIRVCLGDAWQALLVESPGQVASILQTSQVSGAFFACNSAPPRNWLKWFRKTPPQSALNFIQPDKQVDGLARQLLEPYLIATSEEEAESLREQYPHHHVVTTDGQAWYREGWQRRGKPSGSGESYLEYEGQLESLQAELPNKEKALHDAEGALCRIQTQIEEAHKRLSDHREAFHACQSEIRDLELTLKERKHNRDLLGKNLARLKEEETRAREESDHEGHTNDEQHIQSCEQQRSRIREKMEALRQQGHELSLELDQANQAVTEVRIREAGVEQKSESISQQLEAANLRLKEFAENKQQAEEEIRDYNTKISESGKAVSTAQETLNAAHEELEQVDENTRALTGSKVELVRDLEQLEFATSGERQQASELQGQFGKEELEVEKARMKLDALVEHIQKAYDIDLRLWKPGQQPPRTQSELSDLEIDPVEGVLETESQEMEAWIRQESLFRDPAQDPLLGVDEIDWSAVEEAVSELNEKIERMGPVNVEAITEFEELQDRAQFLQQQEEDLVHAREQLHEAIRRINRTTKAMFAETFEQIRKNFAEMFRELFGGGRAELNLEDDTDPLESGIEIIARPPGKQTQSISLLSGGEKTMTAVSLLFAIYMVKPSPFCFLDEMDAPLDESNINRFIRILKRFVQQSQFCVITHNKRTISAADVLYGVTMQEQGVSRLVSMRMSRREESPLLYDQENPEDPPNIADSVRSGELIGDGTPSHGNGRSDNE